MVLRGLQTLFLAVPSPALFLLGVDHAPVTPECYFLPLTQGRLGLVGTSAISGGEASFTLCGSPESPASRAPGPASHTVNTLCCRKSSSIAGARICPREGKRAHQRTLRFGCLLALSSPSRSPSALFTVWSFLVIHDVRTQVDMMEHGTQFSAVFLFDHHQDSVCYGLSQVHIQIKVVLLAFLLGCWSTPTCSSILPVVGFGLSPG